MPFDALSLAGRYLTPARRLLLRQFAQFGVIGAFGFLWDNAIVYGTKALLGPYVAAVLSFIVVGTINWLANRLWTYRGMDHDAMHRQLVRFLIANAVGFVLNRGTYFALISSSVFFYDNLWLALGIGVGASMFVNFFLSRTLVFR